MPKRILFYAQVIIILTIGIEAIITDNIRAYLTAGYIHSVFVWQQVFFVQYTVIFRTHHQQYRKYWNLWNRL